MFFMLCVHIARITCDCSRNTNMRSSCIASRREVPQSWCSTACCSGRLRVGDLSGELGDVGLPKPRFYQKPFQTASFAHCVAGISRTSQTITPTRSVGFAMVVIIHNEAQWLVEWLEYHLLLGCVLVVLPLALWLLRSTILNQRVNRCAPH